MDSGLGEPRPVWAGPTGTTAILCVAAVTSMPLLPGGLRAQQTLNVDFDHAPGVVGEKRFRVPNPDNEAPWIGDLPALPLTDQDSICVTVHNPNILLFSYGVTIDSVASEPAIDSGFLGTLIGALAGLSGLDAQAKPADVQAKGLAVVDATPSGGRTNLSFVETYLDLTKTASVSQFEEALGRLGRADSLAAFDHLYLLALKRVLGRTGIVGEARIADPEDLAAWAEISGRVDEAMTGAKALVLRVNDVKGMDPRASEREVRALLKQLQVIAGDAAMVAAAFRRAHTVARKGLKLCAAPEATKRTKVTVAATRKAKLSGDEDDPRSLQRSFLVERTRQATWKILPLLFARSFFADEVDVTIEEGSVGVSDASSNVRASVGPGLFLRITGPFGALVGVSSLEPEDDFGAVTAGLVLHFDTHPEITLGAGAMWANVVVDAQGVGGAAAGEVLKLSDVELRRRRVGLALVLGVGGLELGGP